MEKYNCNGWKYYIENGAASIVSIPKMSTKDLVIPETLDGYPVEEVKFYFASAHGYSSIRLSKNIKRFDAVCVAETIESIFVDYDNNYFFAKDGILYSKDGKTLVSFPPAKKGFDISCLDGIEIVGDGAFSCCDCIRVITIPDSIIRIGDFAFANCERLDTVYIPDSVVKVGKAVFAFSSLKSVRLPNSIKSLEASFSYDAEGEGFFQSCPLNSIIIPDGVEEIGHLAFCFCEELNEIYIPKSVKNINPTAFDGCVKITKIVVDKESGYFYMTDDGLYDYTDSLMFKYNNGDRSV